MHKFTYIYGCITLLFLPIIAMAQTEDEDNLFQRGVEYYTANDYLSAIETWETIYKRGYNSAELLYNMGNAYFKMDDISHAILFFERAALLSPANEDINYNLQVAQTRIVDRFEAIPELFFIRWSNYFALIFSTNVWAVISLITFIVTLLMVAFYLFSPNRSHKVVGFWLGVVMLFFSIVSLANSIRSYNIVHNSNSAIVMVAQVSGKSSPDNSGTDLFVIHEGTKVNLTDRVGDWYEVRLSDGNKGWLPISSVEQL